MNSTKYFGIDKINTNCMMERGDRICREIKTEFSDKIFLIRAR